MVVQRLAKRLAFNEIDKRINQQGRRNDIMRGLVPIGDTGFYRSSLEPVSPFDCARYPDSPYCGGFPISPFAFELQPVIYRDNCNIGIRLNQTVGFIKFPPLAIVYRYPDCRQPAKSLPFPSDGSNYEESLDIPFITEPHFLFVYNDKLISQQEIFRKETNELLIYDESSETNLISFDFPLQTTETVTEIGGTTARVLGYLKFFTKSRVRMNRAWKETIWFSTTNEQWIASGYNLEEDGGVLAKGQREITYRILESTRQEYHSGWYSQPNEAKYQLRDAKNYQITTIYDGETDYIKDFDLRHYTVVARTTLGQTPTKNNPPPPIDKEKDEEDMACCPEHTALLSRLIKRVEELSKKLEEESEEPTSLEAITEKIDKLSEIIGVDEFPASLPQSLISKDEGFIGNLIPNPNKEIANLTQFLAWYVERFDEIMGQWEIPIEIKDSDPSTPGDQSKMMRLPNIAETMAEMVMLLMQISISSELNTNISTRIMVDSGQDKKQNFITYKSVEAIIDYLGFDTKNKQVNLPMMFTPEKEKFEEILQESDIPVSVAECSEKLNLQADLMRFREASGIIKAIHFRKVDPNSDIKFQIMERLLDLSGLLDDTKPETESEADFDAFLNSVEQGFTNIAGVGDPSKPYGRDYENRPRIRRIKKVNPNEDITEQ